MGYCLAQSTKVVSGGKPQGDICSRRSGISCQAALCPATTRVGPVGGNAPQAENCKTKNGCTAVSQAAETTIVYQLRWAGHPIAEPRLESLISQSRRLTGSSNFGRWWTRSLTGTTLSRRSSIWRIALTRKTCTIFPSAFPSSKGRVEIWPRCSEHLPG